MPTDDHPYSTGFCAEHNPESSHRRCAERFPEPGFCACTCHTGGKPWERPVVLVPLTPHKPKSRKRAS